MPRSFRPTCESMETRCLLSAFHLGDLPSLRNIVYSTAGDHTDKLDVFEPTGAASAGGRPVIVAIHGGGWRRYSKEEYEPTVEPFTKLGYVVVAPDYPLSTPKTASWPVNFEAVEDTVRWVRSHADQLGINPDEVAAMGNSAGGHLAALLGSDAADSSARVNAVVDFYGPTDLAALYVSSPPASVAIHQLLGTTPESDPTLFRAASPTSFVSHESAPTIIVQGTADTVVSSTQSTEFAADLSAAGVQNQLILIPGAHHGFGLHAGGLNLMADVASFLDSTWKSA